METIKNYLEAMFANMPSTPEVWKAKNELYQMMEDKYQELIEEGKTENEAVGTVISEFGNLDELAEALGISETVQEAPDLNRRMISLEEVKQYLKDRSDRAFKIALGVLLCIVSSIGPIITDELNLPDAFGVIFLFACIVAAVLLFSFSGTRTKRWKFLKKESCALDVTSINFVKEDYARARNSIVIQRTIGIILCAFCWIPAAIFDDLHLGMMVAHVTDFLAATLLMVMVGIGVFLIIYSANQRARYKVLLGLNGSDTISGAYIREETEETTYITPAAATVMSVYWQTVACLYLIWSFLTFAWFISWIIWPVAAIVHAILKKTLSAKND